MVSLRGFKRGYGDIIDLTDEKEKAELWAKQNKPQMKFTGDFADFTGVNLNSASNINNSQPFGSSQFNPLSSLSSLNQSNPTSLSSSTSSSDSMFDFLNTNTSPISSSSNLSSLDSFTPSFSASNLDLDDIKKTLRNLSSTTEESSNEVFQLTRKIEMLERRLDSLESRR
ncbi:MAG: hypothetical protein WC796_04830 [Candidatus Pacearchaeota archaeon]|jgi:hypothetical protein